MRSEIVSALAEFGVTDVAFIAIPETNVTALRITDFNFDHETTQMIADDIIRPMGVGIFGFASNALYEGDDKVGAVIHIREAA